MSDLVPRDDRALTAIPIAGRRRRPFIRRLDQAALDLFDERAEAARAKERARQGAGLVDTSFTELQMLRRRLAEQATGPVDELDAADLVAIYKLGLGINLQRYMMRS